MSQWVIQGLANGIRTTAYPKRLESQPGVSPGRPGSRSCNDSEAGALVELCPTGAIEAATGGVQVNYRRCVHCYRCQRATSTPLPWVSGYEWSAAAPREIGGADAIGGSGVLNGAFTRSIHIVVVDAGDCGACLNEVKQLNNPYYNMHRLGFFITPTPRHADVLLVVGTVTDHMQVALRKVYDAMPAPKRVVAVGACALSGGVFAESFVCSSGAAEIVPVDVMVPGHPPPPLAILHGLLVAVGRKPGAPLKG